MKSSIFLIWLFLGGTIALSQSLQPRIMVIPFTNDDQDIRTILDRNIYLRTAIAKIKEGFDDKGYTTVDFVGKLNSVRDNQVFTSENQTDLKSKIIELSGCDIYVIADLDINKDQSLASVNVSISAYEVSTGNSLANKVGNSGKFQTDDISKLTSRAVEKCIDDLVTTMNIKFSEIAKLGRSVLVDFSFSLNSSINMETKVGQNGKALSDVLEEWFLNNSLNSNYHIQGTTKLKMLFDDVKVPIKDKNQNNFSINRYALEIINHLASLNVQAERDVKSNTIYITIN